MTRLTVFIVDDDPGMRHSLSILLETARIKSECFASAEEFLRICGPHQEGCLLLDVRMPGMSGPELQEELTRRKVWLPIIFLTAFADLPTVVNAVKHGALDFLPKPINGALLLERVEGAFRQAGERRQTEEARERFMTCLLKLTRREREVLALAISGMPNKEISTHLQMSQRTVEGHRSRIFLKIGTDSLLKLAQQAADAGISLAEIAPSSWTSTEI